MNTWVDWWQGRALRAENDAFGAFLVLECIVRSWGPSFAEWLPARDTLVDYQADAATRHGHGDAGYWSERAQRSEQHADRLCGLLGAIREHHAVPYQTSVSIERAIGAWIEHRERRYTALPAGHTLEGNLTSGGVR